MQTVYEQELSIYYPEKTGKQYWELFYKINDAVVKKEMELKELYGIDAPEMYDPSGYSLIQDAISNMGVEELIGEPVIPQYVQIIHDDEELAVQLYAMQIAEAEEQNKVQKRVDIGINPMLAAAERRAENFQQGGRGRK